MHKITIETIFNNSRAITEDIVGNVAAGRRILILALIILLCGGAYGFTMGIAHSWQQALSSALKVPALFVLTLSVCIPTLHFIGLFLGSRVSFSQSATVLLMGIAVSSVLLLGFAMIAGFFWITGSQYRFLLLMHVFFFGVAGAAGLVSIARSYRRLRPADADEADAAAPGSRADAVGERPAKAPRFRFSLLHLWMLLYMFVGTQMAFTLSPFVGREPEFYLFHRQPGNFYSYVAATLARKFDERMAPEEAREVLRDPAVAVLHMLQSKDYARLADVVAPQGVMIVRDRLPYDDYGREQDPILDRPDLIEAARRLRRGQSYPLELKLAEFSWSQTAVPASENLSESARAETMNIEEFFDRFVFDVDFLPAAGTGSYNEFSRGLERKQRLYEIFPEGEFVEFVVAGDAGRWDALRLVFTGDGTGPKLRAVIRDRSL